jgi:quercetin dioxygenase-like cupin family protein
VSRMRAKLLLAAIVVTCSSGVVALKAWATPGVGLVITGISGPALLDSFTTKSESDTLEFEMESKGSSDVYVASIQIAPGGSGGWHSHPGPSIISVKSGTASFYHAHAPTTPHVYATGSAFVEDADVVHDVRNHGTTNLELIVIQIVPVGAPRRIDQPAPE